MSFQREDAALDRLGFDVRVVAAIGGHAVIARIVIHRSRIGMSAGVQPLGCEGLAESWTPTTGRAIPANRGAQAGVAAYRRTNSRCVVLAVGSASIMPGACVIVEDISGPDRDLLAHDVALALCRRR